MQANNSTRLYDYLGKHGGPEANKADDVLVEKKAKFNGKPMVTFERVGNSSTWQHLRNTANGFKIATPEHVQEFLISRGMSQQDAYQATLSLHVRPGAIRAMDFERLLIKNDLTARAPELNI